MKTRLQLLLIGLLGASHIAYAACSQPQPRSVCAEYSASKIVVKATLLKAKDVTEGGDPQAVVGRFYTFRADRVFRGAPNQIFRIYEGNDSGRAAFDWVIGRKYVLFLFDSYARESRGEKALVLDGCGNSGPLARANSILREIDRMNQGQQTALISGMVSVYNLSGPVLGVSVSARGGGKVYSASTNQKGWFKIEVSPGDYVVEPRSRHSLFEVSDLSYEDPQHLTLQAGGCAQVQFIETTQR